MAATDAPAEDLGDALVDGEHAGMASDPLPTHLVEPIGRYFTPYLPTYLPISVHVLCSMCNSATIWGE